MTDEERRAKNREYQRKWRAAHPEQHREDKRRWRQNNREKDRECHRRWRRANLEKSRAATIRWTKANPDKVRVAKRKWEEANKLARAAKTLQKKYGVSYGHLCKLHVVQGMACGICGTPIPSPPSRQAHVDHCHDTGKVRGILCLTCNTALGHFERFQKLGVDRVNNYLSKGT